MGTDRRKQLLLVALALAVTGVTYRAWLTGTSTPALPSSGATGKRPSAGMPAASEAPGVHLDSLEATRPEPGSSERNLFAFKPKAVAPPAPVRPPGSGGPAGGTPAPPVAVGPPPTPPLPAIAYKFIGIVEGTAPPAKIAVLSDGRNVFQGREGDIIEGRFRILRIGVESIDMAYLDGRGRQTIRLSGS